MTRPQIFRALDGHVERAMRAPQARSSRLVSPMGAHREQEVLCACCRKAVTWNVTAWCDRCLDAVDIIGASLARDVVG